MRDPEKYIYVEIALPRDHPAVIAMIAEAERLDQPLRTVVKSACLEVYGGGEPGPDRRVPAKRKPKKTDGPGVEVSSSALSSADDFLDDMGM